MIATPMRNEVVPMMAAWNNPCGIAGMCPQHCGIRPMFSCRRRARIPETAASHSRHEMTTRSAGGHRSRPPDTAPSSALCLMRGYGPEDLLRLVSIAQALLRPLAHWNPYALGGLSPPSLLSGSTSACMPKGICVRCRGHAARGFRSGSPAIARSAPMGIPSFEAYAFGLG